MPRNGRLQLFIGQRLWQEALEELLLARVFVDQVVTAALLRVAERLLALLDLAADELRDVGLGELVAPATAAPSALDLQVLDRGHDPAQHHDLVAGPGAHRVLQALLDAGFTEGAHFPVPIS